MNEPRVNIPEWTVSELSAALKKTVEDAYGFVRVRGEISGFKGASPSGHCYFRLKDDKAVLEGVVWKMVYGRLRFKPQEGLEVVATGRLTTYPGSSKYQLIIEALEPAGIGALMALLEERKKKLGAEGLFDEARKQLIPFLPATIGVITSPTGAVIRDILHRLADRFPRHVLVWPVRVQGEGSAEEVAAAIRGFNALPEGGRIARPDVLIVARGGGSLEDLWSFNEEIVVRAAAESMIPLISAVGHETDITLIDFAADKRCPTPTAAAECAVPVRSDLLTRTDSLARRQRSCWARGLDARRTELRAAARALPAADELLAVPRQKLDSLSERLPRGLHANAQIHHKQYLRCASRLSPPLLRGRVQRSRDRLANAGGRLTVAVRTNIAAHRQRIVRDRERIATLFERGSVGMARLIERRFAALDRADKLLGAFSYQSVLARGFALVRDPSGTPLRSASAVSPGQQLDIEFSDGRATAVATQAHGAPVKPRQPIRPRARRYGSGEGQGSLF
ncbi:MAG: exodeoxyribonuclease large subunit [Hyphomicrobiales bacterium]|jgi:exodeoxyribonuclease VII large subunit|nr:exodeoxyribonuclease large subunit [Hyphomicrobiales bacterium]